MSEQSFQRLISALTVVVGWEAQIALRDVARPRCPCRRGDHQVGGTRPGGDGDQGRLIAVFSR
ncbi:hypothetical protein [Nonomuraea dietziae]|uniref:hypothetical protein n=1 Tax=Nonomuraea dietziae TaxID=65515 RepID=UPI0031DF6FCA